MTAQIQLRRGTAAAWTSANPTLGAGEIGIETDTLTAKIGNGSTAWNSLAYVMINQAAVAITGGTIVGISATLNNQTGTTYTIASGDNGKIVTCSNGSAITVTLPNSLPAGFQCVVVQLGAGQVTFSAEAGGSLTNRSSFTKTAGQYAGCTLFVTANSGGTAAAWLLLGDGST